MLGLFAFFLKIAPLIKKLFAFVSKEFFLIFIYFIIGSIITLVLWVLLQYVFCNTEIVKQLTEELNCTTCEVHCYCKKLIAFLFGVSVGCIYLFRLLLAAVQATLLK
jgi:hypothetical protein